MQTALANARAVQEAMPHSGLFAEKEWLLSPEPFPIGEKLVEELDKLGYRLNLFTRACNLLYQLSVTGKQPAWIADYLDRGKSPELIDYARRREFRDEIPQVIRPDIILTEQGFTIAELDTVPGGIGLTAWLNATYARLGFEVIGGENGMIDAFGAILPGGDIVVSEEAATYRPEMEWLAAQLNAREANGHKWRVLDAAKRGDFQANVYRFFEMFDLANVPCAADLMNSAGKTLRVTPPMKPFLEEKMWFALFWMRPLRDFWRRELGERQFLQLQKVIPYTWIIDPAPLPQHGVLPRLEIHEWRELGFFSQKQRELILKISGFSELGWGSRGVDLGQDMPQAKWKAAIETALGRFGHHPYILQEFHKGRLVEHPYLGESGTEIQVMHGRVRLCPYYFIIEGKSELKGVLATVCPADKKLLHGMRDAILAPACVHRDG